jgi:ubiquinone/menaquinone biosynthesis C-methylase UbiE
MLYSKPMIPFNRLGPVFKVFASLVYPEVFRKELASIVDRTRRGGSALDIGSGTGILSEFAYRARKDLRYTMIDPARGMLRFAPRFAAKVIGTAESLPFLSGSFDTVITGDAFHHFKDPHGALQEMRRVMKGDGVLIVFEIDPGSPLGAIITRGEKVFGEPAHFYRPQKFLEMLGNHGFECRVSRYDWRYSIIARLTGRGTSGSQ